MATLGRRSRLLSPVLFLTLIAFMIASGSPGGAGAAPPGCTVTGAAFGSQASGPVTLAPTAPIALPPGGTATGASSSAGIGGALLTTGAISNTATDDSTATAAVATSTSTVSDATLFNPGGDLPVALITATAIRTTVTSTSDTAGTATSSGDVVFENLVVNGVPVAGTFAPNTRIDVTNPRTGAVVGFVIVNEQVPTGDGTTTTGLTVNAARLVTTAPVGNVPAGAEAIIASASSSAACTGPSVAPTAAATATATRTPTPAGTPPTATTAPGATQDTIRLGTPTGGPRPTAVATAVPGLPSTGGGRGTGSALSAVLALGVVLGVAIARALRRAGTARGGR